MSCFYFYRFNDSNMYHSNLIKHLKYVLTFAIQENMGLPWLK